MELGNSHLLQSKKRVFTTGISEPLVSSVTLQSVSCLSSDSILIDNSIGPNYIMYVNFHLQISALDISLVRLLL